jgi:1-phosphofructokinase family hexose kinase
MKMWYSQPRLGELNRAERVQLEPSGKGINVARALLRQGVEAISIAPIGGEFGRIIAERLEPSGLNSLWLPIAGATRCNVKVIDEHGELTEFNAPGPTLSAEEQDRLGALLLEKAVGGDWVVLSGSLAPGVDAGWYGQMTERLKPRGVRVFMDASGAALRGAAEAKPFLLKPNRVEAEELLGHSVAGLNEALAATRQIQARGIPYVVLTLGAEGAVFGSPEECVAARPPKLKPFSTTGCGDALLAGVMVGLLGGWPWPTIARYATAVAVARAKTANTEFPAPAEIAACMEGVELVG